MYYVTVCQLAMRRKRERERERVKTHQMNVEDWSKRFCKCSV